MSQAKITLIGLEAYLNPEKSVFDKMDLPSGIDKDTLIGSILMRCQEFELLYSDPYFLQDAVSIWSRKNYRTFEKWVNALNIEYDPLYNYDRTEEYSDTHSGNYSKDTVGSGSSSNTTTNDLTMTNNLTDTNDVTATHSEKAYNDSNYVGTTQDVTDQDQTHTGTVKNTGEVRDNFINEASGNESGNDAYTNTHTARLYGNIGIVSSQDMLRQELSVAEWNLYEHIADLFCQEFCVMVY